MCTSTRLIRFVDRLASDGWFRLMFPIFVLMTRRQEKANMVHLREALERGAGDVADRSDR